MGHVAFACGWYMFWQALPWHESVVHSIGQFIPCTSWGTVMVFNNDVSTVTPDAQFIPASAHAWEHVRFETPTTAYPPTVGMLPRPGEGGCVGLGGGGGIGGIGGIGGKGGA